MNPFFFVLYSLFWKNKRYLQGLFKCIPFFLFDDLVRLFLDQADDVLAVEDCIYIFHLEAKLLEGHAIESQRDIFHSIAPLLEGLSIESQRIVSLHSPCEKKKRERQSERRSCVEQHTITDTMVVLYGVFCLKACLLYSVFSALCSALSLSLCSFPWTEKHFEQKNLVLQAIYALSVLCIYTINKGTYPMEQNPIKVCGSTEWVCVRGKDAMDEFHIFQIRCMKLGLVQYCIREVGSLFIVTTF